MSIDIVITGYSVRPHQYKGIFSIKITHLESSVLTQNKTQKRKQQINNHETSYQCHCYLLKKRISRMHAILLWRFADDSLKSSVSAFANNAEMCVCVCLCVWAHRGFCVSAQVCALRKILQAMQELCILDDMPSTQSYSCVFLLLPPSASLLASSESFVVDFTVCAWLLCC